MDLGWGRDTDVKYNQVNRPATDMLYSGEQYDTPLQMQYLRARYYDQNVGGFNRLDDYAGNVQDPQSLHKYAYCHGDPVSGIDPSGEFTLIELLIVVDIALIILSFLLPVLARQQNKNAVKNSVPVTPNTWPYKWTEVALNYLNFASTSVPGSGVQQWEVFAMKSMLVSGKIYSLTTPQLDGYTAFGNIYIKYYPDVIYEQDFEPKGAMQQTRHSYNVLNAPTIAALDHMHHAAARLVHEWQHHAYGVLGWRETVRGSSNWKRTYGVELRLARAMERYLETTSADLTDRNERIDIMQFYARRALLLPN